MSIISKHRGVYWDKGRDKWMATVKVEGHNRFLGYFENHGQAIQARLRGEETYQKPLLAERARYEREVCKWYEDGGTLESTGREFKTDGACVWHILEKNGVKRRAVKKEMEDEVVRRVLEVYGRGDTAEGTARKMGITIHYVKRILKENDVKIRKVRRHMFDEAIMDNIDCEWKAYFLGLMMADGCICTQDRVATITLVKKDAYILAPFAAIFDSRLKEETPSGYGEQRGCAVNPQMRLTMCSKRLCSSFIKHGCIPRKSLTLPWPTTIPESLMGHFIRGFFDGDGHVNKTGNRIMMISSDAFCRSMAEYMAKRYGVESRVVKEGKVSRILFRLEATNRLKVIMYEGATMWLKRKRDRFR